MYDLKSCYLAKSVDDAIRALDENPAAVVISGGTDVLIKVREGRLAGCDLVSIHDVEALKGVQREEDQSIVIGSAATFSQVVNDSVIQKHLSMLGEAADQVGGPQIRNMGTIGGNICNGVTSADCGAPLLAMNAVLETKSREGGRQIPIAEWYTGPGITVRKHGEILTKIRIAEEDYRGYTGHYIKYGKREAMEIATLGCAVWLKLSEDKKRLEDIRLAFAVAAPTPIRCRKIEEQLKGRELSPKLYEMIGKGALEEVSPRSSWRASKEFRLHLVEELTKRAFGQAVLNGGGVDLA